MEFQQSQPAGREAGSQAQRLMWALADGRRDSLDAALAAWAQDEGARAAWHQAHLIGDVMRSDELATEPSRDEAFLQRLRVRLQDEPAIVAPMPVRPTPAQPESASARAVSARPRLRAWGYAAAAAGVVSVGTVVFSLSQLGSSGAAPSRDGFAGAAAGPAVAARTAAPAAAVPVNVSATSDPSSGFGADPQWRVLDGKVIRDAQLDAYLRAHRGHSAVSGRFQTVVLER